MSQNADADERRISELKRRAKEWRAYNSTPEYPAAFEDSDYYEDVPVFHFIKKRRKTPSFRAGI